MKFRTERDPLGEIKVPADAYYGVQTMRAVGNFQISGLRAPADLITATVLIKKAAAEANAALGRLDPEIARATSASSRPSAALASAAAFLMRIVAVTRSAGARRPLMGKFADARAVCTP